MHERRVPIPEPCHVAWDEMGALGRAGRYCEKCQHSVIDLSALTEAQAERVLRTPNPDLCVSYLREASGRIVFKKPGLRDVNAGTIAVGALLSLAACSRSNAAQSNAAPSNAATQSEFAPVATAAQGLSLGEPAAQAEPAGAGAGSIQVQLGEVPPAGAPAVAVAPTVNGQQVNNPEAQSGKGWPSASAQPPDGETCDPPPPPKKTPKAVTGPKEPPPVRLGGKPALHRSLEDDLR